MDPLLILALARERELVLWLAIWDFVDAEPLIRSPQQAWQMAFHILDVIELGRQGIVDIDNDDLPVCLLFVE